MAVYKDAKYKVFKADFPANSVFGETYVVAVGVKISEKEYKGEYHIFTQRPKPRLQEGSLNFSSEEVPSELFTVDVDFMLNESLQQAEICLIDRLAEIAEASGKPEILALPVHLSECSARPFVGCWLRGSFQDQIRSVLSSTECESLSVYLKVVTSMALIRKS